MNPVSYLWSRAPESGAKNWLRAHAYSLKAGKEARFSFDGGVFKTELDAARLRTFDHPFLLPAARKQYQNKHQVKKDEVVIDAGAFNGHLSLYFSSQVGQNGRVIAIEPDKANLDQTRTNFELNKHLRNISVVEAILWDRPDNVEFCEQGTGASSAFWMPTGKTRTRKQTTTFDAVVDNLDLPRLDFIKMDIEGAEVKALAGAQQTIRKFMPDFAIGSYHIAEGEQTCPYVERALRAYGYEVETIYFGKECITFGTGRRSRAN